MNENMSENASFDLIWDDDNITNVREMTTEQFREEFGIDPAEFDSEMPLMEEICVEEDRAAPAAAAQASRSTCKFEDFSGTDVNNFIEQQSNKSTLKKTLCDVKKFETFLKSKNEESEMVDLDPEKFDEYLANFILSVRKADGTEYEPSTLRGIISSIDRKLKRQKYPHQIMNNSSHHFQLSRDALRAKQKSLKKQGKGNKPLKASPLTTDEINILYQKGVLGGHNAQSLLNVLWLNNCLMFGMRGTKENYNLRWGDVVLKKGADEIEYLEYCAERQTKTRTGENTDDIRHVNPKMFANELDKERCPVMFYKLYKEKRPEGFSNENDPFYLAPRTASQKINDLCWYMKMTIGEKKLGSFMKCMAAAAGLESQRLTNHSTRKHLVQKLRDSGIAPTDIMQISGHKNIQSVLNYSAMSENKQKQCSKILSTSRQQPAATITNDVQDFSPIVTAGRTEHDHSNENIAAQNCGAMNSINPPSTTVSLQNETINVNNEMNSLFSGAILNIQNFNVYMK